MGIGEAKQVAAALFGRVAGDYDRAGFLHQTARRLVARVPLRAGARVLDVACGTGGALQAAGAGGRAGLLVGVDLAEPMALAARRRLHAAGLWRAWLAVMDAERLPLRAGVFDVVLCASALYTTPDPGGALVEFRRVLRPGGLVAVSVFGDLDQRWAWKDAALLRLGLRLEPTGAGRRLDASTLEQLLREAGFVGRGVVIARERLDVVYHDVDDWLAAEWTHSERRVLELLGPDALAAYRAAAAVAVEAAREPDGRLHWRPEVILATATT